MPTTFSLESLIEVGHSAWIYCELYRIYTWDKHLNQEFIIYPSLRSNIARHIALLCNNLFPFCTAHHLG